VPPAIVLLLVLVLASLSGGCAGVRARLVKPHQRAYLADRIMRLDSERLGRAADQHVLTTREGAFGGSGTAGGGCGCN
jgi:hypothetical protein